MVFLNTDIGGCDSLSSHLRVYIIEQIFVYIIALAFIIYSIHEPDNIEQDNIEPDNPD